MSDRNQVFIFSFRLLMAFIVILFVGEGCTKIDELSDENYIMSYNVTASTPDDVRLGELFIKNDTIFVPLIFGKYSFPLTLKGDMVTSDGVYKTIGYHDGQEVVFENIAENPEIDFVPSVYRFFVMAESGATRTYHIALKIKEHNDSNLIESFDIKTSYPESILLADDVVIDTDSSMVKILYVEGDLPLTVDADIVISDSSTFVTEPALPMQFTSDIPEKQYVVKAASGKEQEWIIKACKPQLISGSDANSTTIIKKYTGVDASSFSYEVDDADLTAGYSVASVKIDDASETITFKLKKDGKSFTAFPEGNPFDLGLSFDILQGTQVVGLDQGSLLSFNTLDESRHFYVIDNMSLKMRKWTVIVESWKSSDADLLSFDFNVASSTVIIGLKKFIVVNPSAVIDNSRAEVFVEVTEVNLPGTIQSLLDPWKATINVNGTTVSQGAAIDISNSYEFTDSNLSEQKTFTITAEDGSLREWKLFFKPVWGERSSLCDVESFSVADIMPDGVLASAEMGIGDTIYIKIEDGVDLLPFSFVPNVVVSRYATTPDWSYKSRITIDEIGQVIDFTVLAEDGLTSKVYKIKAVNYEPPSLQGAEVAAFSVSSFSPAGFTASDVDVDMGNATVIINLSSIGSFSNGCTVNYSLVASEGASVSGLSFRGSTTFETLQSTIPFSITADDGEVKEWTLKLSYLPQFANWNLNTWSGNVASGWANANNSFTTGTTRGSGRSGQANDYAAHLETSLAPIVNKIAAASLFLGEFKFDIGQQSDPPLMTWFGIPFSSTKRVVAIEADVNYTAGNGTDEASICLDLINYSGSGTFEYHGFGHSGNKNATGVVYKKEIFGNTNGWITKRVELDYSTAKNLDVTHISLAFSSGAYGDQFVGEDGSVLLVDNVRIIYE